MCIHASMGEFYRRNGGVYEIAQLALIYGFVLWLIPFAAAMALFQVRNNQRPLFESIMPVLLSICAVRLADLYWREVETHFVREGILLNVIWLAVSIGIDLLMFMWGPMASRSFGCAAVRYRWLIV